MAAAAKSLATGSGDVLAGTGRRSWWWGRRLWWWPAMAVALGAGALWLAVVSGLAVEQARSTYAWGVPSAPVDPDGAWHQVETKGPFTTLLLAAPPYAWDVRWTCDAGSPEGTTGSIEVFRSVAHDGFGPAVRLTLADATFAVTVADEVLAEVARLGDTAPGCSYRFTLDDGGDWRLVEGDQVLDSGSIHERPLLTGFGSDLVAAPGAGVGGLEVMVTTQRHGSMGSAGVRTIQGLAVLLAALAVMFLVIGWRIEARSAVR